MESRISILGSTGSIGRQTLEAADNLGFVTVCAIAADKNIELLERQIREYRPALASVFDGDAARDLQVRVRDTNTKVASGLTGLADAAQIESADTVVTAVSGTNCIIPTLAAIDAGKRVALANKETLVCAGEIVMKRAAERGAAIIPVDSEHSAIFQCIDGSGEVKRIILTASGGPFRGLRREETAKVTPEMALKHPNWSMGKKITIDSATMMNKGLEYIEAVHLFSVTPDKIKVIIHPQSVIHSMVEFLDNSVIAQLAGPDMRLPIQYALTYPERLPSCAESLDFAALGGLTFEEPDLDAFPCLKLAIDTAGIRGVACAVLCGADDAAVDLFIRGSIGYNEIYEVIGAAVRNAANITDASVDDIIEAVKFGKRFVYEKARELERKI